MEGLAEPAQHLVLPLDGERRRAQDEDALDGLAELHLLDEQAGHDGLAGAGIVGEQEAQPGLRQHLHVDRLDLVRKRADAGEADGELAGRARKRAGCGPTRPTSAGRPPEPEQRPLGWMRQTRSAVPSPRWGPLPRRVRRLRGGRALQPPHRSPERLRWSRRPRSAQGAPFGDRQASRSWKASYVAWLVRDETAAFPIAPRPSAILSAGGTSPIP